jgi:hypothetical protein
MKLKDIIEAKVAYMATERQMQAAAKAACEELGPQAAAAGLTPAELFELCMAVGVAGLRAGRH